MYVVQTSTRTSVKDSTSKISASESNFCGSRPKASTSMGLSEGLPPQQAPVSNLLETKSKPENSLGPGQASVLSAGAGPSEHSHGSRH